MKRFTILSCLFALISLNLVAQAPTLTHTFFASGFSLPVAIANCHDDRLFIVEQRGKIKISDLLGNVRPFPFLDIDSKIINSGNERGLLGLAFHPDYKQNGYFYVYYSDNSGGTVVARYSVSASDSNQADPNSEQILLTFAQPYSNHNGGCIQFGPDGYLYIASGDGGSAGDPQGNGQKKNTFLGKMLRIDVDNGSPYGIPPTNPFIGQAGTYPEIWALGLRNPWRFSFDRITGDMWIGDVGQNSWEEIDFQPASSTGGENYGWKCKEGNATYSSSGCGGLTFTDPVYTYTNNFSYGCSVTGGYRYRGGLFGSLYGYYVHADYCTGRFWVTWPDGMGGYNTTDLGTQSGDPSTFGEDMFGEMYWASLSNGTVYKIVLTDCNPTAAVNGGNEICQGGTLTLSTPAYSTHTYQWYLNGVSLGNNSPNLIATTPGDYYVVVTNFSGCSATSDTVTVTTVSPSTASINSPQTVFFDNDPTVTFTGSPSGGYFIGPGILGNGVFDPAQAGVGTHALVYVYEQYPCATAYDTVEVTVNLYVSTENPLSASQISVSPNPASGAFWISFGFASGGRANVSLMDLSGKTVFEQDLGKMPAGNQRVQIDPGKLAAGLYLVQVTAGKQKMTTRITIN